MNLNKITVSINEKRELTTTSKNVADVFEKTNHHVMDAIHNLDCSDDFRATNFRASSYTSKQNKELACIEMTFDGFTFLCMGFTGKAAAQFKEAYIAEFNRMRELCHKLTKLDRTEQLEEAEYEDRLQELQEKALLRRIQNRLLIAKELGKCFDINEFLADTSSNIPAKVITDMKLAMGSEIANYGTMDEPRKSLTALLKEHKVGMDAGSFNDTYLRPLGLLKGYYDNAKVTTKGLYFGANDAASSNKGTTQPRWFVRRFPELLQYIRDNKNVSI